MIVIIVRDRFEESPKALGEVNIIDPSLQKFATVLLDKKSIQTYAEELQNSDTLFEKKLQKAGIKFVKIYTDEDPTLKLISLMNIR